MAYSVDWEAAEYPAADVDAAAVVVAVAAFGHDSVEFAMVVRQ